MDIDECDLKGPLLSRVSRRKRKRAKDDGRGGNGVGADKRHRKRQKTHNEHDSECDVWAREKQRLEPIVEYPTTTDDGSEKGKRNGTMREFVSPASKDDVSEFMKKHECMSASELSSASLSSFSDTRGDGGIFSDFSACSEVEGSIGHAISSQRQYGDFSDSSDEDSDMGMGAHRRRRNRRGRDVQNGAGAAGLGGNGGGGGGGGGVGNDADQELEEDDARWKPCLPKDEQRIQSLLGRPQARSECFGCRVGARTVTAPCMESVNQLIDIFRKNFDNTDDVELVMQLHTVYEKRIREPANERLQPGQEPLPVWAPATIYQHFFPLDSHWNEPSVKLRKLSRQLFSMLGDVFSNSRERTKGADGEYIYRIRKKRNKTDRDPIRDIKDIVAITKSTLTSDPKKMIGYSKEITVHGVDRSAINTDRNWSVRNPPSFMYKR